MNIQKPATEHDIKILCPNDPDYPQPLKQIKDKPRLIYYRGKLLPNLLHIALVGTRKMSNYGKQCCEAIISGLQGFPIAIVSGLAYGIDACAHETALQYGLYTVAVLGSGVDDQHIYPKYNQGLAKRILDSGGAIISEFPAGSVAYKMNFPKRNRIISGLCRAVAIMEADLHSGSLITAEHALEQNRDLFSVPGSIFNRYCQGTNNLLRLGAKVLQSCNDIINEYPELRGKTQFLPSLRSNKLTPAALKRHNPAAMNDLTAIQKLLISRISAAGTDLQDICEQSGLPIHEISSNLVLLEIKNKIRSLGNNIYSRLC